MARKSAKSEASAKNRLPWRSPVVRRLSAGAAEIGDAVNPDGNINS